MGCFDPKAPRLICIRVGDGQAGCGVLIASGDMLRLCGNIMRGKNKYSMIVGG